MTLWSNSISVLIYIYVKRIVSLPVSVDPSKKMYIHLPPMIVYTKRFPPL